MDLFLEASIDQTTMYMIAEKAGVTRRTVYNYYESKEQIAVDLQILCMEEMRWFELWIHAAENISMDRLMRLAEDILTVHYREMKYICSFDHFFSEGYPDERYVHYLHENYHIRMSSLETGLSAVSENGGVSPFNKQILFVFQIYISYLQRIILRNLPDIPDFDSYRFELSLLIRMLLNGMQE